MSRRLSHVRGRTLHCIATSSSPKPSDSQGDAAAADDDDAADDDNADDDAGAAVPSAAWAPHDCWQTVGQKSSAIARCAKKHTRAWGERSRRSAGERCPGAAWGACNSIEREPCVARVQCGARDAREARTSVCVWRTVCGLSILHSTRARAHLAVRKLLGSCGDEAAREARGEEQDLVETGRAVGARRAQQVAHARARELPAVVARL
eukprot:7380931-Prymnesium_polylepis.2